MNRINALKAMDILWDRKNELQGKLETEINPVKVREIQAELMGCHEGYDILEDAVRADRAKDKVG